MKLSMRKPSSKLDPIKFLSTNSLGKEHMAESIKPETAKPTNSWLVKSSPKTN